MDGHSEGNYGNKYWSLFIQSILFIPMSEIDEDDNSAPPISSPTAEVTEEREEGRKKNYIPDPKHVDFYNGQLHLAFISGDYNDCKAICAEIEEETGGRNVFAKIVRGIISREEGDLDESLKWFNDSVTLCPSNYQYGVQVGRIHFLAGRHIEAVQVLQRSMQKSPDSMCCYWLAKSLYHAGKASPETLEQVKNIVTLAPHLNTRTELLKLLAQLLCEMKDEESAIPVYRKLIELEPENISNYVLLGQLYMRLDMEIEGFSCLGRALSYNSSNPEALLGVGYVMQKNGDHEVAMNKYKISAVTNEYDGCLWNNIGMCLYAKGRFVSAISCLKKSAYLYPLEYKIFYNLGLSHLSMNQLASAYHFLSASLSLKPNEPNVLSILAIVLTKMKDIPNARKAYKKAIENFNPPNSQTLINYAIFEYNNEKYEDAAEIIVKLKSIRKNIKEGDNQEMIIQSLSDRLENSLIDKMIELADKEGKEEGETNE